MELVEPRIEQYALDHTSPPSGPLAALRAETEARTPRPFLAAGLAEARLLEAFAVATRAMRVLDVGTFTGSSALSIASRLGPGGTVITLEIDEEVASIARRHFEASPYADRIQLVLGDAVESIQALEGPFDLVFLDAWKRMYAACYEAVLPKLADHGLIIADNMLWHGGVLEASPAGEETIAIKAFADLVQADDRVDNVLLTVGDGLLLLWKRQA